MTGLSRAVAFSAVLGIGEILPGADLAGEILQAMNSCGLGLASGDVAVVAQKIVSKAEARVVDLRDVRASPRGRNSRGSPARMRAS